MLRIRLLRGGNKNHPQYRLVVTPQRTAPQTGKFLEVLGFYNPLKHEKKIEKERVQYWISQGAQPSDTVRNMLISEGIIEGKKVAVHHESKKKAEDGQETAGEAKEAPATESSEAEAKAEEPAVESSEDKPAEEPKPAQ
jgi:small subunit ribosomal protein S16